MPKNNLLKYLTIPIIVLLAMVEKSFLPHFGILGGINLVFVFIFTWNFFEKPKNSFGILLGFLGGLTIDFFSNLYFGVFACSFLLISLSVKKIINRFQGISILSFLISFLISFLVLEASPSIINFLTSLIVSQKIIFNWGLKIIDWPLAFLINFIFSALIFILVRIFKTESISQMIEN